MTHRKPVQYPTQFFLASGTGPGQVQLSAVYYEDINGLLGDPAADALRAIGTNALPFLVQELRRKDSGWAVRYGRFYVNLPVSLRKHAPSPPASRDSVRSDASLALAAIGPNAASTVPAIIEVFGAEPRLRRMRALHESLQRLPWPPDAFDPMLESLCRQGELLDAVQAIEGFQLTSLGAARVLTNALLSTNTPARDQALRQFNPFGRHVALVLPALVATLDTSDPTTRQRVARMLGMFGADAADALPALERALKSSDGELRYQAARAIESMGTNATPAIPALTAATNDANVMVQRVASRTLRYLNGSTTSQMDQ